MQNNRRKILFLVSLENDCGLGKVSRKCWSTAGAHRRQQLSTVTSCDQLLRQALKLTSCSETQVLCHCAIFITKQFLDMHVKYCNSSGTQNPPCSWVCCVKEQWITRMGARGQDTKFCRTSRVAELGTKQSHGVGTHCVLG